MTVATKTSATQVLNRRQYDYAASTLFWDSSRGNVLAAIVDKDCYINAPTKLIAGNTYFLELHFESYDSPRVTFHSIFLGLDQESSAPAVTLDRSGGKVNVIEFYYNGVNLIPVHGWSDEYRYPWATALESPVPNIATNYVDWRWWNHRRIGQYHDHCPLARKNTYYFSNSLGNDSTGNGSQSLPFKSLTKLQTIHDSLPTVADTRFRMLRGDVWQDGVQVDITKQQVTVDDWGTGAVPELNHFTRDYTASTWTNDIGNRYALSESNTITWVREIADKLGETRGTHLIRVATATDCTSTANSWFWTSSGTVYVNLSGDSPNTKKIEGVVQNSHTGIKLSSNADGCRLQNIKACGYGAIGANLGYNFMSQVGGNQANMFIGCEGYYSGTHIMGQLGTGLSGGKLMMLNCKVGLCIDPAGESQFIGFSALGSQEVWNEYGTVVYGAAKNSTWNYATSRNNGGGFAAHTTSGAPMMIVSNALNIKQGITGAALATLIDQNDDSTITGVSDFPNCKAFEVNTVVEQPAQGRLFDWGYGRIKYGCKYYLRPNSSAALDGIHTGVSEALRTYFVNCYIDIDYQNEPNANLMAFFKGTDGSVKAIESIHSWWNCRNLTGHDLGSAFNYDLWADGTTLPGAGSSHTSKIISSMLTCDAAGPFNSLALTNQAANVKNNAFWNIDQTAGKERGYDNGVGNITLSAQPVLGTATAALLQAGYTGVLLSNDINGKKRTVATPDVGPEDFSS
jgi:hypothetical protein